MGVRPLAHQDSATPGTWQFPHRRALGARAYASKHTHTHGQARVLLRLGRVLDVAERGLAFIQSLLQLLAEKQAAGLVRPWFKEVRHGRARAPQLCAPA